ncbi:MAG: hypothetical protein KGM96_08590 [Acidobacteriota bacterium]|nr:hypothetical protein [Acidobacteriota bacterium]
MRQDVYRVAYDEAISELSDIINKYEQLRQRKERVEKAVEVLKPLVGAYARASSVNQNVAGSSPDEPPPPADPSPNSGVEAVAVPAAVLQRVEEPISYPAPQAVDTSSDPFQRRINNALKQGFGGGESREFARAFAGGLLRGR